MWSVFGPFCTVEEASGVVLAIAQETERRWMCDERRLHIPPALVMPPQGAQYRCLPIGAPP